MKKEINYPWFKKEDVDGFFALFQNNLANFAVIAISMLGMGFPVSIVFGRVIPGAAIAVLFGNFYYARMARRLAEKEGREDVTALSYGISTPVMFIYLFGILGTALTFSDGDPEMAWRIGTAAAFLGGAIEALGSIIGPWIRRNLPRAAMLGALAGVAFTFIGGELFFTTYEMPIVGLLVMGIIIIGLVAKKTMPFNIPTSLFAIIVGTVLAYLFGAVELSAIREGLDQLGFYPPMPTGAPITGLGYLFGGTAGLLAVVIPIQIYNLIETMNNVEAMAACGDDYNVREAQLADGFGTMIGAFFGGVFPTTVYIASTGAKHMEAGRGYSIVNGIVFFFAALFGIIGFVAEIIPLPVIAPILVFVGITMVGQAFVSSPPRHAPAVVIAMFPYLSDFVATRFQRLDPAGFAEVFPAAEALGQGPMFTGLIWGAFAVFVIDRKWNKAVIVALFGFGLSAFGFMHAPQIQFQLTSDFALGYLVLAVVIYLFSIYYKKYPELTEPKPIFCEVNRDDLDKVLKEEAN